MEKRKEGIRVTFKKTEWSDVKEIIDNIKIGFIQKLKRMKDTWKKNKGDVE